MANVGSPWLIRHRRIPDASIRLFCFHCAGGSASEFRSWPQQLPRKFELVAVQLPGREARVNERFITGMDELISGTVGAMTSLLDKPYAVFGHSFGAVGGFETIRELRRRGLNQPFLFIAAGRPAPHIESSDPPIASLPKESFIEALRKDYGHHIEHILASAELREVFVPQIHADFALFESYRFRAGEPIDCPIVAFAGVQEDELDAADLSAWSAHSSHSFHSRRFPGDHFFLRESQSMVVEAIRQEIFAVQCEKALDPHLLS